MVIYAVYWTIYLVLCNESICGKTEWTFSVINFNMSHWNRMDSLSVVTIYLLIIAKFCATKLHKVHA